MTCVVFLFVRGPAPLPAFVRLFTAAQSARLHGPLGPSVRARPLQPEGWLSGDASRKMAGEWWPFRFQSEEQIRTVGKETLTVNPAIRRSFSCRGASGGSSGLAGDGGRG